MKTQKGFELYKGAWCITQYPHHSIEIDKMEAYSLLKKNGFIVRNVFNWDKSTVSSFWFVIKDSFNGIEELPTKVRNQVRKALKTYEYRKLSNEDMAKLGPELFNKSRERLGITDKYSDEAWAKRVKGENKESWVGFDRVTGKPAAFALNMLFDDYCDYNAMGISPDVPNSTYPMYGLIYEMNRYYLEKVGVNYVMDGARSITEHSNIQDVLEDKFRFRKAYCDLQVFYKPWIGVAVTMLFPFRRLIKHPKISAILRQEAWARGEDF